MNKRKPHSVWIHYWFVPEKAPYYVGGNGGVMDRERQLSCEQ